MVCRSQWLWLIGAAIVFQGMETAIGSSPSPSLIPNVETASGMVFIPAGLYRPLFPDIQREIKIAPDGSKKLSEKRILKKSRGQKVNAFYMDRVAVTQRDFQVFVQAHPQWARSRVKKIFADDSYLADWRSDFEGPSRQEAESPVQYVSWFAARAFCQAQGKRLPLLAEWERAAADYENFNDFKKRIVEWYGEPTPEKLPRVGTTFANRRGVWDLHGLVWEWVEDFNSNLVTGESRGDSALERDAFCGSGALGASDFEDYAAFMRFGFRSSLKASFSLANLGFRCVSEGRK